MPYTITYNTPTAARSSSRDTAALALEVALDLQATGHSTIQIIDPSGSRVTVDQLAQIVHEQLGAEGGALRS